jgi:single-stranded DNA-binding protein
MGVIVVGTLDQRSWDDKETGQKRSTVEIKAMEIGARVGSLESVTRRKSNQGDSSSKPAPKRVTVPADEPF